MRAITIPSQPTARMRAGTVLAIAGGVLLAASAALAAGSVMTRHGGSSSAVVAGSTAQAIAVTNQNIAFFQERVERDPADVTSYAKLGAAYTRQARETGDVSAYSRAEAAYESALAHDPNDLEAQAGLASVRFAFHDFSGALALATQVYEADAGATQALALIGDAHVALGEYDEAAGWYAQLDAAVDGQAIDSRLANLAFLRGDTDGAIELMQRAVVAAASTRRPGESLAWYRSQLAELYYSKGDYAAAQRWYEASLAGFDGYAPALAGLGAVAAARGDDAQAIDYYERSVAVVPLPVNLAALGDLYVRTGDGALAQDRYDTVEFIGKLAEINRNVYNRELALFYADHNIHTAEAVGLALAELEVRQDIYGYDAAAWALYADGRAAEAQPYMQQALQDGTRDARLLYHAGMINKALGRDEQARQYLSEALDLNPHFAVPHDDIARAALAELER